MKTKNILATLFALTYAVLLIVFAGEVRAGVQAAVMTCLNVIIPALFSFMVICDFFITSQGYKALSKPFAGFSRYVFRLEPELFSIFLLSSIAGYPIGARLVNNLYVEKKIDKETAQDMVGYCYLGGPAFICGVLGGAVNGAAAGLVIFFAIFLANMTTGFVLSLKRKIPKNYVRKQEVTDTDRDIPRLLTASVVTGGVAILKVSAMIIFFSSVTAILGGIGVFDILPPSVSVIIKSVIEISNIKDFSGGVESLPIAAALLSFGGICVITQVRSFLHSDISMKSFYFSRFLAIINSYLYSRIIVGVLLRSDSRVISAGHVVTKTSDYLVLNTGQVSPVPAVFLLIMTVMLLAGRKDGR